MNLLDYLCQKESVSSVITSDRIKIGGTTDAWNMMLMACDFYQGNASVFVVLPNLYLAQNYYDELIAFMPEEDVLFFPSDELVSAEMIAATGDFLFERIQTLYTLLEGRKKWLLPICTERSNTNFRYLVGKTIFSNSNKTILFRLRNC